MKEEKECPGRLPPFPFTLSGNLPAGPAVKREREKNSGPFFFSFLLIFSSFVAEKRGRKRKSRGHGFFFLLPFPLPSS